VHSQTHGALGNGRLGGSGLNAISEILLRRQKTGRNDMRTRSAFHYNTHAALLFVA